MWYTRVSILNASEAFLQECSLLAISRRACVRSRSRERKEFLFFFLFLFNRGELFIEAAAEIEIHLDEVAPLVKKGRSWEKQIDAELLGQEKEIQVLHDKLQATKKIADQVSETRDNSGPPSVISCSCLPFLLQSSREASYSDEAASLLFACVTLRM